VAEDGSKAPTNLSDESRLRAAATLTMKPFISASATFVVVAIVDFRVCFSELEMLLWEDVRDRDTAMETVSDAVGSEVGSLVGCNVGSLVGMGTGWLVGDPATNGEGVGGGAEVMVTNGVTETGPEDELAQAPFKEMLPLDGAVNVTGKKVVRVHWDL